jgi:hypothetical protein
MRTLTLLVMALAVSVPPVAGLAGVAPNTGASSMSQSGAKVVPAKRRVEDDKNQREEGKESTK